MSWDAIVGMLSGNQNKLDPNNPSAPQTPQPQEPANPNPTLDSSGQPKQPSMMQSVGNTLLGNAPRTDKGIPTFTGDIAKGLTDPHGLVGQATRLIGAIASFSHSPQMGMAYLSGLQSADASERKDLSEASARGWTPQEYEAQTGNRVPAEVGTTLQPRNAAVGGPSLPNRVAAINYPTTPEELKAARDAEFSAARALPTYGQGMSSQTEANYAALAQREKMPLSGREKSSITQEAMNQLPSGQYKQTFTADEEGLKGVFSTLPPEDQSMDMATFNKYPAPEGYAKFPIPDASNPGQVYMKILKTDTGDNIWSVVRSAADGDPTAIKMLQLAYPNRSIAKTAKPGSFDEWITNVRQGANREITPSEEATFRAAWGKQEDPLAKPGSSPQAKARQLLIDLGVEKDPAEVAAEGERSQRYKGYLSLPESRSSGPATPEATPQGNTASTFSKPTPSGPTPFEATPPNAPPVVPKPLAKPGEGLPKSFKKKTFHDLDASDIEAFTQDALATLTSTKSVDEAGKEIANTIKLTDLSKPEKAFVIHSIVQGLGMPATVSNEIERSVFKEVQD